MNSTTIRFAIRSALIAATTVGLMLSVGVAQAAGPQARQLANFQDQAAALAGLWVSYALGDATFDPTASMGAVDCLENQPAANRVIVLTGNYGGTTVRSCNVPDSVPLFFPVVNCFIGNYDTSFSCATDVDCDPLGLPAVCSDGTCLLDLSVDEKTEVCDETTSLLCDLAVELDGVRLYPMSGGMPVLGVVSPPTPGWIFGDADSELIASGYWALLSPLAEGSHTLTFSGGVRGPDGVCGSAFSLDVTYLLTVNGTD